MAQAETIKLLKKERRWMGSEELSKKHKVEKESITNNLRKMYKFGEVKRKEGKKGYTNIFLWKAKQSLKN